MERIGIHFKGDEGAAGDVHPLDLDLTGKPMPMGRLHVKFSVCHGGAVGLLLGKDAAARFEDDVVYDRRSDD